MTLRQLAVAEALGTCLLVAAVVGSGIMAASLAQGNAAVALLANTGATGAALLALILTFGPISGAHFNPIVTGHAVLTGALPRSHGFVYVGAQLAGGATGAMLANVMFDLDLVTLAGQSRHGARLFVSEVVATFGLVTVIASTARHQPQRTPGAVAAYIMAAYWFTASTSFANPAVTIARSLSDSFAGIRPVNVAPFIAAQLLGGFLATLLAGWLLAGGGDRRAAAPAGE